MTVAFKRAPFLISPSKASRPGAIAGGGKDDRAPPPNAGAGGGGGGGGGGPAMIMLRNNGARYMDLWVYGCGRGSSAAPVRLYDCKYEYFIYYLTPHDKLS